MGAPTDVEIKAVLVQQANRLSEGKGYIFTVLFGDEPEEVVLLGIVTEDGVCTLLTDEEGNTMQPPSHAEAQRITAELNSESRLSAEQREAILDKCGFNKAN